MDKFLKRLEMELMFFESDKRMIYVQQYKRKLEENVAQGKSEEEAIHSLGNFESILESIYKENQLNYDMVPSKNWFKKLCRGFYVTLTSLIDTMSHNNRKQNGKIIVDLLIMILIIAIAKIPFVFGRDMIISFVNVLTTGVIIDIIRFIFEVLYILVAFLLFMRVFKRWFSKVSKDPEMNPKYKEELTSFSLEDK